MRYAKRMFWPNVGRDYLDFFSEVASTCEQERCWAYEQAAGGAIGHGTAAAICQTGKQTHNHVEQTKTRHRGKRCQLIFSTTNKRAPIMAPPNGEGSPISSFRERRAAVGTVQEGLKNRCSFTVPTK